MKVLVSINIPDIGIEMLRKEGLVVTTWTHDLPMTDGEFMQAVREHDILLSSSIYKIDSHFLNRNRHLKLISQYAAGYDNIDVGKARELGIPVTNTPNAMVNATADICFGLMMAVSRKMFYMHKRILADQWSHFRPRAHLGMELQGKTLGIFGLGRIGMALAKRCRGAYDMQVIYHNRSRNQAAEQEFGATYVSFEELLGQSDVISVHAALTEATRGIFDREAFRGMKPSAIFLNTARGAIHNERDLMKALEEQWIWGCGLDVTDPEPMRPDNPLLQYENVAITPHIGSATSEARNEMSRLAALNILQFCRGEKLINLVV